MTDLALDMDINSAHYGDLLLTDGDLSLTTTSQQELRQTIKTTLSTYLGEWFMGTTVGIDYFGQILVKNPDMGAVNAMILGAILDIPGIVQVTSYRFVPDYRTRKLSITFTARTTTGIITYAG